MSVGREPARRGRGSCGGRLVNASAAVMEWWTLLDPTSVSLALLVAVLTLVWAYVMLGRQRGASSSPPAVPPTREEREGRGGERTTTEKKERGGRGKKKAKQVRVVCKYSCPFSWRPFLLLVLAACFLWTLFRVALLFPTGRIRCTLHFTMSESEEALFRSTPTQRSVDWRSASSSRVIAQP